MSALLGLSGNNSQKVVQYSGLNISSSRRDLPVPIFWGERRLSTNAIWYNDFQKHPISAKGKGGGAKGSTQYDYTAAVILGLCEGPIDSVARVWQSGSTTTTTTLTALNLTLFTGTASQAPWSFVSTKYPAQARSYGLTAYLACPKMDLGSNATIPDNSFECVRSAGFAYTHTTGGWINPDTGVQDSAIDVLLSDVINDLLTSSQYGMGFSAGDIGDRTQYAAYLRAQGLFFSPMLNSQEKVTAVINRWAQLSNSWIYWSGTQLQFVPLGDSSVTANGATYTPDNAVAYDLGPGDLLGDTPVKVSRVDPADCYNRTVVQINDRTLGYVSNPIEYKDQTLVDQYGLRDSSTTQADDICDPAVGAIVAQLLGRRAAYIRNTYSFKTSYHFVRCLPGTVVTLTDPNIGITKMRVRIRTVAEDDDQQLSFTAEEFPGTTGTYTATGAGTAIAPTVPNQNMDPGNINTPAVVEPDSSFTQGVARLYISASGGANWGGADVFISFDSTNYTNIGTINAPAPQGVLTAALADHADPDTINTLAINCAQSLTVPQPVTTADADALRTLALVCAQPTLVSGAYVLPSNGELLAFGTVTATGTYTANLTYLRRGKYGTIHGGHSTGDQFTVVDVLGSSGTAISYDLPAQYIGQPIYLKFMSFNPFKKAYQDLASVIEYKYIPTGAGYGSGTAGKPKVPSGLTPTSLNGKDDITWNANSATDGVIKYRLWAAPGPGGSVGAAVLIFEGQATHFVRPLLAAGTVSTYFVEAFNVVGTSGLSSGVDASATSVLGSYGFALSDTQYQDGGDWSIPSDVTIKTVGSAHKAAWVQAIGAIDPTANVDLSFNCSYKPNTSANMQVFCGIDYLAQSTNLFTLTGITNGNRVNADGTTSTDASYSYSGFIPVVAGMSYTANQSMKSWCFYNGAKSVIPGGSDVAGTTFTAPAAAVYVKVTVTTSTDGAFALPGPVWALVPGSIQQTSTQSISARSTLGLDITKKPSNDLANFISDSRAAFRVFVSASGGESADLTQAYFKVKIFKDV